MRLGRAGKLFAFSLAVLCVPARMAFPQAHAQGNSDPLVAASPSITAAQSNPRLAWGDWFFGQRRQGLGYIPDNVLPKAVAQRNAMLTRKSGFGRQDADPGAAVTAQWLSLGPTVINSPTRGLISGRITSLAIDTANPSTVYIASAGGGVWKSTDHGNGWTPLTDTLPSLSSGAVAVDPFSGEVWYGTGELDFCRDCFYGAGVYRSADGGADWTRVAPDSFLSSPTSVIAFDRRNQGTLFIGRSTALWRSTDDGQTWHATLQGTVTDFALNPADSTVAYAALGNAFGSPQNGVYRSSDGGQNWTRLGGGLPDPSSMGRIALTVDPSSPATVYALITRSSNFLLNGLYRSTDGGNNWNIISSVPASNFQEAQFANGLFNILVRVDPKNSRVIYVGSNELLKSSDGGNSWQNLHMLEGEHDVVFDPSDLQAFYLINNSGVWRSPDGGQNFVNLNTGLGTALLQAVGPHPTNPNVAVGSTQDNGTILYGGGFAWDQGRLGDAGNGFYEPSNPQKIYASGHYTDLFRSDDGGKTWLLISPPTDATDRTQFYAPFVKDPSQPGVLYFATHRIWRSQDQGNHWSAISGDLTGGNGASITTLSMAPNFPQLMFAGTSDSHVLISFDGGRSWSQSAPMPNRFVTSVAIHPYNPSRAYLGLSGFGTGHVFRTDDRGGNWVDVSANLPDVPVNAILIDALSPDRVYLGTDIGVFVLSSDGTWVPLSQGMPNVVVLGLSQNPANGLLIAATHGRGAFALTGTIRAPHLDALVNAASLSEGGLAPGTTINLLGSNLAGGTALPPIPFPLPYTLAGTTVMVNGITAPLYSTAPGQVDFLVPFVTTGQTAVVTLSNPNGQATVTVPRTETSPGIFSTGGDPNIFHANGTQVSDAAPARPGEEVVIYATGLGGVDQVIPSGLPSPANPAAKTLLQPNVQIGGISANVVFSGLTPGLIATYQVNAVVPSGFSGKVPVVIDMGGGNVSNTVIMSTSQQVDTQSHR